MADETLVDRIYEAAFVPDLWKSTIETIAERAGAASGALLLFSRPGEPQRFVATPLTEATWQSYMGAEKWKQSQTVKINFAPPADALRGFIYAVDYLSPEQRAADAATRTLATLDLGPHFGTVIPMATGEVVTFTFERWLANGRHTRSEVATLNGLRPHLARAALMAARLGLERAQTSVALMEKLGLPAAVLTASGRVLAANPLLERLPKVFIPRARGALALPTGEADALLTTALAELTGNAHAAVRSIPLAASEEHPAMVVHVLPLRRAAHDIFAGGDVLIAATEVSRNVAGPSLNLLMGLFDLTAAEARLAAALSTGVTLAEAAAQQGIQVTTARAYLARIFRKTGTVQQSQLVALLRSAQPLGYRQSPNVA